MSRFKLNPALLHNLRQAEHSSRLEGVDTRGDEYLNALKMRVVTEEITAEIYFNHIQDQERQRVAE